MADVEKNIYYARLAEQGERFEDICTYMKAVIKSGHQLTSLERNLLSVGYKNTVASRRAAWRTLSDIQETEDFKKSKGDDKNGDQLCKWYKEKIQDELQNYCNEILDLLQGPDGLIAKQQGKEAAVFFKKMKGDYFRYLCEIHTAQHRKKYIQDATDSYREAELEASNDMKSTHPIKLGLALNYSVFYYEIMTSPDIAHVKAKKAFDEAVADLDEMDEAEYPDSAAIMQLLRDNLTLWQTDLDEIEGAKDAEEN